MPNISEDYVHRIGRTGRAGASGEAISLVSADETTFLRDIEKLIDMKIEVKIVEGFEPDPNASTEPIRPGQNRNEGRGRNSSSKRSGSSKSSNRNRARSRRPQSDNRN